MFRQRQLKFKLTVRTLNKIKAATISFPLIFHTEYTNANRVKERGREKAGKRVRGIERKKCCKLNCVYAQLPLR